jgi:hypothetical protein
MVGASPLERLPFGVNREGDSQGGSVLTL